jgi:uncharacterized protein YhdP
MVLNGSGIYRYDGRNDLHFNIASNRFSTHDIAPMIPKLRKYDPAGTAQISAQGIADPGGLKYQGQAQLSGISFRFSENSNRVEDVNGNVFFSRKTLRSQALSCRIGSSTMSGSGELSDFTNPSITLRLRSPHIDPSDLGFPGTQPVLHGVQLQGSYSDGNVELSSLSATINRSDVTASGKINNLKNPSIDLAISSQFLDIDDLMLVKGLQTTAGASSPKKVSGQITLVAEAGTVTRIPFKNLHSKLQFDDGILNVSTASLSTFGGTLNANGWIHTDSLSTPSYRLVFDVRRVDAAQMLQFFKTKRQVTGLIDAGGELASQGRTLDEIKRSLKGKVSLTCSEGSLKKFSVLSKVFSILNLSQLLKGQLPDMVSGGMPFNRISSTFSVENGIAETKDLQIDSDAINISMVGKFNLLAEDLDLTVGVKPLQTVDKIVSHIPIVGWVLTGKNRSIINAYFEAKGPWENPRVRPIPVKSLAKGVFNIFKRVFQLPAKLITDTGEVVLNTQ